MLATYSLTHMTGKPAQANRVTVVQGFEAKRRTWVALCVGAVAALVATPLFWVVLGMVGLLPGLGVGACVAAAMTLQSKEAPDRLWVSARRDRMRSEAGKFFVCGEEVDPTEIKVFVLMKATVPAPRRPTEPDTTEDRR